ncbi:tRNA dihydrouridine synthase DusB [Aurantimonas sp. MSK8Z-1]|nr:tRNA dihydrouridine synthase DusB [Aurantimonas sp. MSK8Z-1]MCW4114584.1 tRNA dihydrouridine synthase DusB [Aurantimonas sp. MSK8Z-1]
MIGAHSVGSGVERLRERLPLGAATLGNRVFMAPLSGISDVPFRRLARRFGAGMVVSEMVASGEFARGDTESAMRAMRDSDGVHVVQLAGREAGWMRAAAERLARAGVDVIDINMGCPAKKVVGGLSGSALMRDLDHALQLVEATVAGAGGVPVTLKMRLGWDRATINAPELARRAEAAGVRMVTVHGRTRDQFYDGSADWKAIAAVKAAVTIPVAANGDLTCPADAPAMLGASGADAVMVGRAACGRPWLAGLIAGACTMSDLAAVDAAGFVTAHYEAMLEHYGASVGLRHARKHLAWYCDRLAASPGGLAASERAALLSAGDPGAVMGQLLRLFDGLSLADLEAVNPASELRQAA